MKAQTLGKVLRTIFLLVLALFENPTYSQRHSPIDIERTTSVDKVTHEEILKVSYKNDFEDIIKFAPKTHHIDSREIIYKYKNSELDKTVDDIYYDANNFPSYLKSVTTNKGGTVIEGREEVFNNKILIQGYKWFDYKGKRSAQLYKFDSKSYANYNFQPSWQPMFQYTKPEVSSIISVNTLAWEKQVKDIYNKGNYNETILATDTVETNMTSMSAIALIDCQLR